jgi:nicotinamidase-related amidase
MGRARVVDPRPGEVYVFQTIQFHRALRRCGIENLIHAGFATDMCSLRAPGGIQPMYNLGYWTFLMRDATLGVECTDTFEERAMTAWGIRCFETHLGDTMTCDDFVRACARAETAA